MWVLAGKEGIIQIKQKTDVKNRHISALCKDSQCCNKENGELTEAVRMTRENLCRKRPKTHTQTLADPSCNVGCSCRLTKKECLDGFWSDQRERV